MNYLCVYNAMHAYIILYSSLISTFLYIQVGGQVPAFLPLLYDLPKKPNAWRLTCQQSLGPNPAHCCSVFNGSTSGLGLPAGCGRLALPHFSHSAFMGTPFFKEILSLAMTMGLRA